MTGDMAPLAMTMGDPAGIGPELTLAAWRDRTPGVPFVIFAAPAVLAAAAKRAGIYCADHRDRSARGLEPRSRKACRSSR